LKITLDSIISGFKSVTKLIANFDSIESELNDKVLDMNGSKILNLQRGLYGSDAVNYEQFVSAISDPGFGGGTVRLGVFATEGQQSFTTPTYIPGANNLSVYREGLLQTDYQETSNTTVFFTVGAPAGTKFTFIVNERVTDNAIVDAASVITLLEGNTTNAQQAIDSLQTDLNDAEVLLDPLPAEVAQLQTDVIANSVAIDNFTTGNGVDNTIVFDGFPYGPYLVGYRYWIADSDYQGQITLPSDAVEGDRISFILADVGASTSGGNKVAFKAANDGYITLNGLKGRCQAGTTTGSIVLNTVGAVPPAAYDNPLWIIGKTCALTDFTDELASDRGVITGYDSSTNTITVPGLVATEDNFYRIVDTELTLDQDNFTGEISFDYKEGRYDGWVAALKPSSPSGFPGPRRTRKFVNPDLPLGDEENLEQYLIAQDDLLSARLDSSDPTWNLVNQTITGSSTSGATIVPVTIHWEGTDTFTLNVNETILSTDRFGDWIGDREPTYITNASIDSDFIVAISGVETTVDLTLCNGSQRVVTDSTISFTAPDTISDSSSGFGDFTAGDVIAVTGSVANEGTYRVLTATANSLVVDDQTISTVSAGSLFTIKASVIKGPGDVIIPAGCQATVKRISNTEVMVTTPHGRVYKEGVTTVAGTQGGDPSPPPSAPTGDLVPAETTSVILDENGNSILDDEAVMLTLQNMGYTAQQINDKLGGV
jgi:hypothetical protein